MRKIKKGASRMLALLLSLMLLAGMLPTTASAADGASETTVTVDLTAQAEGAFLMAPQFDVAVSSNLAESYGYDDQVTDGVSALDVAVKAHELIFGEAYTPETKDDFFTVSSSGMVSKQFGDETYSTGFYVNNMYPHDGTLVDPNNPQSGYNGYLINQCPVKDGDLVELFNYISDFYMDTYTWMLVDGAYTRDITVEANTDLAVTVEGFWPISSSACEDLEALIAMGQPCEGLHIGTVDAETGAITPLDGAVTNEDGAATLRFAQPGTYLLAAYYEPEETDDYTAALLSLTRVTVTAPAAEGEYLGVKTEAKVYDDFENDLWLQYQHREMQVGDTASMYPWRVPQIIGNSVTNDVQRPTFHFEVISGDSVTLSRDATTENITVTAVKPGTSVVQVTYDALEYNGQQWGAISPVNTGYVVYTVGETGTATITVNEELENWQHYNTIYYNQGETVPYSFTVDTANAQEVVVTVNGVAIQGNGNQYTANLENRSNIIGIVATDAQGNTKSLYRVIDARFIEVNVGNKTRPGEALTAGDTANISFRGITMPVYKLAAIYNPQFSGTKVTYKCDGLGQTFEGICSQWDLATNNDFDVAFSQAGEYTFYSQQGIYCSWWGSPLGTDMTANGSGEPGLGSPAMDGYFSVLPNFTVSVADSVAVSSVTLNAENLNMKVGDSQQLTATVLPENATHPAITWGSSDTGVVTVDNGLVTAVGSGQAQITATADGKQAVCTVTVSGVEIGEVNQAIAALPDADSLTLRHKAAVEAARQLDNNLSQADQERVTGYDRLTAAEEKLAELMQAPFLFSVNGQILPMENTGEETGSGYYYKVTIPEGTTTVQIERYKDITVQDIAYNTLIAAGTTTVDISTADHVGRQNYFILNHDLDYNHIYFEVAGEEPPSEDTITVYFTLLGDSVHGDPTDETGKHTLVDNNLETWIAKTAYTVKAGSTAKDLFELALTENGLTWTNPSGSYVTSITRNGVTLAESANGSLSGWLFTINGVHGDYGISDQLLTGGDEIVFHYTDDFLKEFETPSTSTAVQKAEALIDALPPVDQLTLDDAAQVQEAKAVYDALSDADKADVSAASKETLDAAVARIAQLQAQAGNPDPDPDLNLNLEKHLAALLQSVPNPVVGTTGGEWAVLALARAGYQVPEDYYSNYYRQVVQKLESAADNGGLWDANKYTEYARVILALTSIGYDPTDVAGYNLLEMLTDMNNIERQGINGPIWALIAFDSGDYAIPQTSGSVDPVTREKLIASILAKQLAGGGWALTGDAADPDLTAMAIQALAPYYDANPEVKAAVDQALDCLSRLQLSNGGFISQGEANLESCAQVIVALTALGINPATDERFVKENGNPVSALLAYALENGGFQHTLTHNEQNGMASEQGTYALVAYDRFLNGKTSLYDMSDVVKIQNPSEPETEEKDVTLVDVNGSGVTITGKESVLNENMELEATLITSGDLYSKAQAALKDGQFTLYELCLLKNNIEIQPDGTVTISIPVPNGYTGASCKVYRVDEDGSVTQVAAALQDGKLVFETSQMGAYAVWQPVPAESTDPGESGESGENQSGPSTGDNGSTPLWFALSLLTLTLLAVLAKKKQQLC